MQTTTPLRARRRWLLSLLIGLFACYFMTQVVVMEDVWTPTGPFNHFENSQPHRVTTWVSVSVFGRSLSLPIFRRDGMKNTQFE
jgi:hypothetical protein